MAMENRRSHQGFTDTHQVLTRTISSMSRASIVILCVHHDFCTLFILTRRRSYVFNPTTVFSFGYHKPRQRKTRQEQGWQDQTRGHPSKKRNQPLDLKNTFLRSKRQCFKWGLIKWSQLGLPPKCLAYFHRTRKHVLIHDDMHVPLSYTPYIFSWRLQSCVAGNQKLRGVFSVSGWRNKKCINSCLLRQKVRLRELSRWFIFFSYSTLKNILPHQTSIWSFIMPSIWFQVHVCRLKWLCVTVKTR